MKLKLFIAGLGSLVLLTGCSTTSQITELDYSTLEKMWEEEETFILEVVKDDCSYCDEFAPRFNEVLSDNDIEAYSINISHLSEEELDDFFLETSATSTPTVIFYTKGEEKSVMTRIVGSVEKDKIVEKLEAQDYIK